VGGCGSKVPQILAEPDAQEAGLLAKVPVLISVHRPFDLIGGFARQMPGRT
jgi:hypothetical protein